jgi:hypothetical protein
MEQGQELKPDVCPLNAGILVENSHIETLPNRTCVNGSIMKTRRQVECIVRRTNSIDVKGGMKARTESRARW